MSGSTIVLGALALFGASLGLLALIYWRANPETRPLDEAARATLRGPFREGGAFVALSAGTTFYKELRPKTDSVGTILMVHGGTLAHWAWARQTRALTAAGFTVLLYDMYGRGYSDRLRGPHTRAFYVRQIADLLDALHVSAPVHMITTSFGSAIAAQYTAAHASRVGKMVFMAPVAHTPKHPIAQLLSVPVLGALLYRGFGRATLGERLAPFFPLTPDPEAFKAAFEAQFTWRGTEHAMRDMLKTDALGDYRAAYRAVGEAGKEVMIIRGGEDVEITLEEVLEACEAMPCAEFVVLPGVGHNAPMEVPERVNALLVAFLERPTDVEVDKGADAVGVKPVGGADDDRLCAELAVKG